MPSVFREVQFNDKKTKKKVIIIQYGGQQGRSELREL